MSQRQSIERAKQRASFPPYPVIFEVAYPERQSRMLALVRLPLLVPIWAVSVLVAILWYPILFLSWPLVLLTGRYPRGLFDFAVSLLRWNAQQLAYQYLLTDRYPALLSSSREAHPVHLDVLYPERSSRILALFRWFIALPALIVFGVFGILPLIAVPLQWFLILVNGRQPRGLFQFQEGAWLWNFRLLAYISLLRDEHPPYSTQRDARPTSSLAGFLEGMLIIGFITLVISDFIRIFQPEKRTDDDWAWEFDQLSEQAETSA